MNNLTNGLRRLSDHYSATYKKHGCNSNGADWGDEAKHVLRLRSMLTAVGLELLQNGSVLDVGCGYGQLYSELQDLVPNTLINYTGLDPCKDVIRHAQSVAGKNSQFICGDIQSFDCRQFYDTVFCCGVFTKKVSLSDSEMYYLMELFFLLARSARASHICFNTMSAFCNLHAIDLFYPDIGKISAMISRIYGYGITDFCLTNSHLKYELIWRFSVNHD
jgi:SAM-dependent methyltransferase